MSTLERRQKLKLFIVVPLIVVLAAVLTYVGLGLLDGAVSEPKFTAANLTIESGNKSKINWPSYGQSAIATKNYGAVARHGETKPQPTASTAKLITALAVMKKAPFDDEAGETITFTDKDVESYQKYVDGGGTVAKVEAGLTWTYYQAIEAILLASSNNVSDSLAIKVFGSLDNYREYAQQMVKDIGMSNTTIGVDASGYDPSTVSTADDMALLALAAIEDPMIRQIVAKSQVDLPVAGQIENTNRLLVNSDIIGMKTGWIPEAGGTFVLAGDQTDGEHSQKIAVVVMGDPNGPGASTQNDAYELFKSAKQNFSYQELVTKGQVLGSLDPAWAEHLVSVQSVESIGAFVWSDQKPEIKVEPSGKFVGKNSSPGRVVVRVANWRQESPLELSQPLSEPSLKWRLVDRYLPN